MPIYNPIPVRESTDYGDLLTNIKQLLQLTNEVLELSKHEFRTPATKKKKLLGQVHHLLNSYQQHKEYLEENQQSPKDDFSPPMSTKPQFDSMQSEEDIKWLENLKTITYKNIDSFNFNAEFLSDRMGLSRRQLHRKLKKLTGQSPSQYLKEARLQQARTLLENRVFSVVKIVCYEVGMKDVKYFSQQFKKRFGRLPSDYL